MLRTALTLGLALSVAAATGASTISEDGCVERCADDDADGNCPPDCTDCVCCPHLRVLFTVAEVREPVASQAVRAAEQVQTVPASPEPGDILHVPKSLLA